ncbi:unnamed protein product [Enterobius vermicularis]|uniref:Calponin-homology (CH) domain-containing protein n=1 Tax=Enterobius vermicularis TaxID=51028 RepID=A0A0N4UTG3_ENTVE|nr:unnamed protein product [Enterobius vermicularis]
MTSEFHDIRGHAFTKKFLDENRYEFQASVFLKWASAITNESLNELSDIFKGKFLSVFTQLITGKTFVASGSRSEDISTVFQLLDDGDRFAQINILDVTDGNLKALCSVVWQFIQLFWKRFGPEDVRDQKLSEVIKDWCLERTKKFEEVQITDFTSSWRDGFSLNALLASYNAKAIAMNEVREMRGDERLEHAMSVAERRYGVPRLLMPKDFVSEYLDMKCVVCYLMMIYLALAAKKTKISVYFVQFLQNVDARSRKSSSSSQRSGRKGRKCLEETVADYESCLEQVLTWLLEAEERANNMDPVEEKDVELVKIQFREHESFMQSLTDSQDSVGRVLHR